MNLPPCEPHNRGNCIQCFTGRFEALQSRHDWLRYELEKWMVYQDVCANCTRAGDHLEVCPLFRGSP